ncbi:hypothetical protein CW362_19750 [Streptomyces populi]|uniref:Uncharacterized protein n=1 Tax=Streptomyces populi TaxID=2058924 RepID=A0A2I0SMZ3_9ACTN|nr:hypothetical protein CW362_19750 [Streptomyces populi]
MDVFGVPWSTVTEQVAVPPDPLRLMSSDPPFMKPFVFTTFRHGKVLAVSDLEEMPSSFQTEYAMVTFRALPVTAYSTSTVFEASCEMPAMTATHPPATNRTSTSSTHGHLRLFFLGGAAP